MITPSSLVIGRWGWRARLGVVGFLAAVSIVSAVGEIWIWSMNPPWSWEFNGTSCGLLGIVGAVLMVGQGLLLAGAPQWRRGERVARKKMWMSVVGFGLVAALLAGGMVGVIYSLLALMGVIGEGPAWVQSATFPLSGAGSNSQPLSASAVMGVPGWWWVVPVAFWVVWGVVFGVMVKLPWRGRYGRVYRWLVKGTVLELACTVPVDIWVRQKTNCYCDEGSSFALIGGLSSAGILFGPGVVLLALRRRNQWMERNVVCFGCGYDLRGLAEARCPECGREFSSGKGGDGRGSEAVRQ